MQKNSNKIYAKLRWKQGLILAISILFLFLSACNKTEDNNMSTENDLMEERLLLLEEKMDDIESLMVEYAKQNETDENSSAKTEISSKIESNTTTNTPASSTNADNPNGQESSDENDPQNNSSLDQQGTSYGEEQTAQDNTVGSSTDEVIILNSNGVQVDFDKYLSEINKLEEDIKNAVVTNIDSYHTFKKRMNEIEDTLDYIDDVLEQYYRDGTMSRSDYASLDSELDVLEDKLDRIEDQLESKFGIDD